MTRNIVVPDLGESVLEATVARWLKKEGDAVRATEPVLVLETDKVDLEVAAGADGILSRIERGEGEDVRVGDVLGMVSETGEGEPAQPEAEAGGEAAEPAVEAAPAAEAAEAPTAKPAPVTIDVTPVARRFAEENKVDIAQVQPSTPGGRVTKEDVQRFLEQQQAAPAPAATATKPPAPTPPATAPARSMAAPTPPTPTVDGARAETRIRMSRRRRTIAQRLLEAQHNAAMLTTFNEIDMSKVVALRARRKEAFQKQHNIGLGFMSFFVKAVIGALKAFPQINSEIQGDEIVLKHYYDIGIAIGAEEGLVVPVIRDADRLSFAAIEQQIKDYAEQARNGTLSLEALRGGTFTITNGGVFGSLMSTPILNPPQVGILGMHRIQDRPVVVDGEIVIRPMMYVALSYDHRVVDGREAVQFLVRVKELVEDPETLLLEG